MAVVLVDGFDMFNGLGANTGVSSKWIFPDTGLSSIVAGRFGGQAIQLGQNTNGTNNFISKIWGDGTATTATVGVAIRNTALPSGNSVGAHVKFIGGANSIYQIGLRFNSNGGIQVLRMTSNTAGTSLGSTANGVLFATTWQYLEAEVVIDDTVGRVTLYVDGTQVLNLTGVDTNNSGGTIDTIRFGCGSTSASDTGNWQYDDVYVLDVATKLAKPCKVETLRGASDILANWTRNGGATNFSRINETLVDGDTTYNESGTLNQRDLYSIGSMSTTPADIYAAQVVMFPRKTDAAARTLYPSVQSAGVDSDGSAITLAANYNRFDRLMELDPNGGVPWSASRINGLYIGPKVAS